MATKRAASLEAAMNQAAGKPAEPAIPAPVPPSRQGKRAVTGFFDPLVARELRKLAAEHDRSIQSFLAEAINDLFRKYKVRPIA